MVHDVVELVGEWHELVHELEQLEPGLVRELELVPAMNEWRLMYHMSGLSLMKNELENLNDYHREPF